MTTDTPGPRAATSSDSNGRRLDQLKDHVVQIESLNVYTASGIGILSLAASVDALRPFLVILACGFLAGLGAVVRVTNPTSSLRNRLTWGASLGGLGAAVGSATGALIDVAALGLTAGAFTAAGLTLGAFVGAAIGDRIESRRNQEELMERGKAFAYLYGYRHKNHRLSNPDQINKILDTIEKYDPNRDGHWHYTIEDLEKEARRRR
jgi:hypothetical protein